MFACELTLTRFKIHHHISIITHKSKQYAGCLAHGTSLVALAPNAISRLGTPDKCNYAVRKGRRRVDEG